MSAKANHKVLIVDDEPDILEIIQFNLNKEGYDTRIAQNGKKALEIAKEFKPQLVLMDIMMPQMDGVEACRQMRELNSMKDAYIIFLTARTEEFSEVAAFEAGANDFINKPIKPRALLSRIEAAFRRNSSSSKDNTKLIFNDLTIDKSSYTVVYKNNPVVLPKKEFELLSFLAQNPNKVFTRDDLLQNIWGSDVYVLARTVDVHVRKVREKIGDGYIATVKGVGYKFEVGE
ncbi:MAG: Transcriptional regulatory protein WalR [candidate division WS2 bacterium]|uniref:Transcriptional regulatory protein WalR n=1 Tax=Psychracetigena formicireducens TaxID=2986056 RepID=A0A9E2F844_PSYF1|nr:Transcriptional regulatory protein WalR [Candidatus Psychracetigena formicireducens]